MRLKRNMFSMVIGFSPGLVQSVIEETENLSEDFHSIFEQL